MPHNLSPFNSQFSPPAARRYNSSLSIWLSVDPMVDKYPGVSPYTYCANNPVRLVDANGREISTHTDKDGNVLAVYDDGYLGIFKHTDKEVTEFYNGTTFENNLDELVGFTFYKKAQNTIGDNLFFPQQVTYGEKSISNYFQRLGYENIKTIRDLNSNFDKIWED